MISNTSIQTIRILKCFSNQTGKKKNFKKLKKKTWKTEDAIHVQK